MLISNQFPYPIQSFPDALRLAAKELMDGIQVTDVIAGNAVLTTLAMSVSPLVDWRHPLSDQIRPCVLYQAIAAISGDRKSTAEGELYAPFMDHDLEVVANNKANMEAYKVVRDRWSAVRKRAVSKYAKLVEAGKEAEGAAMLDAIDSKKPSPPLAHRIIHSDATKLALFEELEGNGKTLTLTTDEGSTLLDSPVMKHFGFLSNAWDGKKLLTMERSEHKHIVACNARLNISFMIQPHLLMDFINKDSGKLRASGFFGRFLFSRSVTIQGTRTPRIRAAYKHIPHIHKRLRELLKRYNEQLAAGQIDREILEFDEAAKATWINFAAQVEAELNHGGFLHDISDFGNKFMDMVGRIACLIHFYEACESTLQYTGSESMKRITSDTLQRAYAIANWHLSEFKQLFSAQMQMSEEDLDANKLHGYLFRQYQLRGQTQFQKNYLRQYSGIRNSARLTSALQILASRNALTVQYVLNGNGKKGTEMVYLTTIGYAPSSLV